MPTSAIVVNDSSARAAFTAWVRSPQRSDGSTHCCCSFTPGYLLFRCYFQFSLTSSLMMMGTVNSPFELRVHKTYFNSLM
jgi:hypothetical protein